MLRKLSVKRINSLRCLCRPFSSQQTTQEEDPSKIERFDTPEGLRQKVDLLAEYVRRSNYMIGFTGSGISTSAGIPDYRSGANTVLETGPGKWVTEETMKLSIEEYVARPSKYKRTDITLAQPTYSHHAIRVMLEQGVMKHLIS